RADPAVPSMSVPARITVTGAGEPPCARAVQQTSDAATTQPPPTRMLLPPLEGNGCFRIRRPRAKAFVIVAPAMSKPSQRRGLRAAYARSRSVDPRPITGREKPEDLLAHAFGAYVGRQERTAFELMQRSVAEDCSIFLTLSGAMTPAGLHQSCLIPLIERGLVSALTTTGANLYHDAHRIIGHALREVNPNAGDLQLRLARVIRIYDLGFWEEALLDTDKLFSALMQGPEYQRKMTTPEFHALLGRDMAKMEKALGVAQPSLLSVCFRRGVPIFVGAVQDGSIFLNAVKLRRLFPETFKFEIDINE